MMVVLTISELRFMQPKLYLTGISFFFFFFPVGSNFVSAALFKGTTAKQYSYRRATLDNSRTIYAQLILIHSSSLFGSM